MKKRWILLIVPLLMALMMNAASASELLGNVLSLVLNSPDDAVLADDCRADAEDARIIIASGAHYQLIAAAKQENGWESAVVSTNAVYQPSEGYGVPTLTRTEEGFELAYPDAGEIYRFALRHDSTNQPMYTLVYAKMGDMEVAKRENFGYLVTQGEDGLVENGHAGGLQYPPNAPRHSGCSADERNGLRLAALCKCAEGRRQGNPPRMAACADSDGVRHLSHG